MLKKHYEKKPTKYHYPLKTTSRPNYTKDDEGNADYGEYVLRGIRGKGLAKVGPIDFLGDGLNLTLEAYK